jgi:enamine deaminase RidA (YjgF/YER057c/UK114 family)
MNHQIAPAGIAPPAANYAHAVLTEAPARLLHTAGVVPVRPDGTVPDGVGEQAEVVWANVAAIFGEAGMAESDVVSVTTYVVAGEPLAPVMAARDHFPVATSPPRPSSRSPPWPGPSGASRLPSSLPAESPDVPSLCHRFRRLPAKR